MNLNPGDKKSWVTADPDHEAAFAGQSPPSGQREYSFTFAVIPVHEEMEYGTEQEDAVWQELKNVNLVVRPKE